MPSRCQIAWHFAEKLALLGNIPRTSHELFPILAALIRLISDIWLNNVYAQPLTNKGLNASQLQVSG